MTDKIWDPLRKKNVTLTPEEKVRQWFISVLSENMKVPVHMMNSEVAFNLGDKMFRADIMVFDRAARPLAVVECKRENVPLDTKVLDQAVRYNMALNVRYIMVTNGRSTYILKRGAEGFAPVKDLPTYNKMLEEE